LRIILREYLLILNGKLYTKQKENRMKSIVLYLLPLFGLLACKSSGVKDYEVVKNELRAPAYPLVTIDPYTSAWSMTDNLYDGAVKHWTGKTFRL
jgi:L-glutaminase (EC 3.5.1.2)